MDGQHDHQEEQGHHHEFGDPFHTVLDAEVADGKSQKAGHRHPEQHRGSAAQHAAEGCRHSLRGGSGERAFQVEIAVIEHPARHRGIVHHQHIAADDADPFEMVPARAGRFQDVEAPCRAAAAAPADGEFADHDGDPHDQQEDQIDEDEGGTAELAAQVREFPDIADPDGTAGGNEDEAESCRK